MNFVNKVKVTSARLKNMLNELQDFDFNLKFFLLWAFQKDSITFLQREERFKKTKTCLKF